MNFPVSIESSEGRFTASLLGAPEVRVSGATRQVAISELRRVVSQRVANGQIASLEIPPGSVTDFIGVFQDDPRRFATELEQAGLQVLARQLADDATHPAGAGEVDATHSGVGDQCFDHGRGIGRSRGDEVDGTRREAGFYKGIDDQAMHTGRKL